MHDVSPRSPACASVNLAVLWCANFRFRVGRQCSSSSPFAVALSTLFGFKYNLRRRPPTDHGGVRIWLRLCLFLERQPPGLRVDLRPWLRGLALGEFLPHDSGTGRAV